MKGPLSGIRVTDLTRMVAGSTGTQLVADLGAEVIKIEPPEGDPVRTLGGAKHGGSNFIFLQHNRNKRSVVLDLYSRSGKKAFYDLVKLSDVVWDNFRPGVMERLGADYEALKKVNPQIICCSVSGYGESGPYRDLPSYDIIAQALSGIMSITGETDGLPVKTGPSITDLCSGIFAGFAVCAALTNRERTGEGQKIEISLLDVGIYLMGYHIVDYLLTGIVPKRMGSGHIASIPHNIYETAEGYLAVGPSWPRIARAIGEEWMIDDPRFKDLQSRLDHREEFEAVLKKAFLKAKAEDWIELFRAQDMPVAPVNTVDKVVVDPHVLHRKMMVKLKDSFGGVTLVNQPMLFSECPALEEYTPPPVLGEHTDQVLADILGYSTGKIRKLKEEQAAHATERLKHLRKSW